MDVESLDDIPIYKYHYTGPGRRGTLGKYVDLGDFVDEKAEWGNWFE